MLTADDTPTIRWAINKRLGALPHAALADIKFAKHPGHITVGVLLTVKDGGGEGIVVKSVFELPDPFELAHLHDEIDEIAEQVKLAARDHFLAALPVSEERLLPGSGRRGRWARYGLRVA